MKEIPVETDATARFSDRVKDYARCRPDYPPEVLRYLDAVHGLAASHVVADVGAGTGIWSEHLLRHGCTVLAVEPNEPMRAAAEQRFAGQPRFHSMDGRAEATGLADGSVDWVMAAQAFHWFDAARCRTEFSRILKTEARPAARVVLIWNNRREDTPFLRDYEELLRTHGTDYMAVKHQHVEGDGTLDGFYGGGHFVRAGFANSQCFDYGGLEGRTLSASYTPRAGDPRRATLVAALRALFDRHARDGRVEMLYETCVYVGSIR